MSLVTIKNYSTDNVEILKLLNALLERSDTIMSAISDFAAKQNAFNTRMEASVQGIGADVKKQNDLIKQLQDSAGTVTPADQALIDQLQANGETLASKFEALDALTPPATPVDGGGTVTPI